MWVAVWLRARPEWKGSGQRSAVKGRVAPKANAGTGEDEQDGGDSDGSNVPGEGREAVVGELGDNAESGVNREREGECEKAELYLDHVGDRVVVKPVAGCAEEVVGKPQSGDDLHGERWKADAFEALLELADCRGAPFA